MKFDRTTLDEKQGVHRAREIPEIINYGTFHKSKYWDKNSMFITLPRANASLHVTRLKDKGFEITAAEPAATETVEALKECPIQPRNGRYNTEQVGHVVRYMRDKFPATQPGQEAAAPPVPVR
jgi:hypothetical protein